MVPSKIVFLPQIKQVEVRKMEYQVKIKSRAKNDIKKIKRSKGLNREFIEILQTLEDTPFKQTQSVEKMHYGESTYSRRIDRQHRVVYEVVKKTKMVVIFSAYGHY